MNDLKQTEKKAKADEFKIDLFVPNRGKKSWNAKYQNEQSIRFPQKTFADFLKSIDKRNKIDLDMSDLFLPNRGKKHQIRDSDFLSNEEFFPNRGKRSPETINHADEKNIRDKNTKIRKRRDIIDNLSKESKDTFYLARGRRYQNDQVK